MYDTVTFLLEQCRIDPRLLDSWDEWIDPGTGEVIPGKGRGGYLGNLNVNPRREGVYVSGSLPRFHLGSNFDTLTRSTTEAAIENLSDRLHADFRQAKVCRIDLAQNYPMNNPVPMYTSRLFDAPRLKRRERGGAGSVYFENYKKSLVFYDKCREAARKKTLIPELYKGRNVLRYEARFSRRLSEQFAMKDIRGEDLIHDVFYVKALTAYRDGYFSIQKIGMERIFDMGKVTVKDVKAFALNQEIERQGGFEKYLAKFTAAFQSGILPKKRYYDIRKALKSAASFQVKPRQVPVVDLMTELDQKVSLITASCY